MIQRKWESFFILGGGVEGAAHNPTWTNNQNSVNTLFTSEEHRMVLDEAREEADGFTGKPLAIWYRLQPMLIGVPAADPDWDGDAGLQAEHYRHCISFRIMTRGTKTKKP